MVFGQSDLTLYNFNAIPQSLHVNPGMPQQTKVWVGLPAISGIHVHFQNTGFTLAELIPKGSKINVQLRQIADEMDDDSHLALNQEIDLLGIGFKAGRGFVSLGATQSISLRIGYPSDVLRFISYDQGDPVTGLSLNEFDYESMVRTNFYLGYQHKFMKNRLTLGFRAKYMYGQQHSEVESMNAQIDASDPFLMKVRTNISVRSSGLSNLLDPDLDPSDDPVGLALTENTGLGFDFGGNFLINRKLSVNFSVLDLGSIDWKDGNEKYVSNGEFDFEGIELDLADQNFDDVIEALTDSLANVLGFDTIENSDPYPTKLSTRIFAGLNYNFHPKHGLGLLYHAKMGLDGKFRSDYSVNYQGRWFRGMQFIASYSMINGDINNVGAGVDFKFGPLQLYIISDNILGAVYYENLKTTNIRLGLNITFYGKKEKDPKDMPFFDSPSSSSSDDDDDDDD
tara:strand:+ start:19215 stop:20573 length:1359 start_codon:yes stop_codon:yes gene_type:complete